MGRSRRCHWRQGFRQPLRARPDRSGQTLKSPAEAGACFTGLPGAPAPAQARSSSNPSERSAEVLSGPPPVAARWTSAPSRSMVSGPRNSSVAIRLTPCETPLHLVARALAGFLLILPNCSV